MIETLLAPLSLPFMQTAFVIAALTAAPAALLSCFLVLKGWSLIGDAVSHAVLPGVVIAYLLGGPIAPGAFAAGLICALASGWLQANSRLKQDTVLGVVFSGMFALGVVLFTRVHTDAHLDHILFGDVLGVGWGDVAQSAAIAAVVLAALALRWRDLLMHAFDAQGARAVGLRVRLLHYGLLCLLSLTVVAALQASGIILTIALLIVPGATAFLLTSRFDRMLPLAAGLAVGAALLGVYLSFYLDSAPAPTIVLLLTAVFGAALLRRMALQSRAAAAARVSSR